MVSRHPFFRLPGRQGCFPALPGAQVHRIKGCCLPPCAACLPLPALPRCAHVAASAFCRHAVWLRHRSPIVSAQGTTHAAIIIRMLPRSGSHARGQSKVLTPVVSQKTSQISAVSSLSLRFSFFFSALSVKAFPIPLSVSATDFKLILSYNKKTGTGKDFLLQVPVKMLTIQFINLADKILNLFQIFFISAVSPFASLFDSWRGDIPFICLNAFVKQGDHYIRRTMQYFHRKIRHCQKLRRFGNPIGGGNCWGDIPMEFSKRVYR